jgi:hypothetical protein
MANASKQGACSAHIETVKANCLKHDRREGNIPSYVNPNLTKDNRIVFEDEMISGRKSIIPLITQAEKLYTSKTGQKCQKSFAPFREDVLKLKPGITDEQLLKFKAKVEEGTGWKVVGIYLHQDEGYYHSKYIEGDEDFAINYHAHVLYSCQDQNTGKAIRLNRSYFKLRQDWLADATGMERGTPASETGIKHRSSMQQRIFSQEQRIAELERKKKEAKASIWHKAKDIFGADKDFEELREIIKGEPERTAAAVATAKAEERQQVITEIKQAAQLHIGKEGHETAEQIGAAWRRNYDKVRSLEVDIQSMDAEHNAAIYRATQESECKAEAAQKEAKLWKNRFAEIWPTAIKAIAAIVEKVNNTWQNLFTDKQVKDIDAAMHNARNQEERIIYAKDLMNLARPEFMRDEGDTAKQVEDIARNGLNVQKINTGVSY